MESMRIAPILSITTAGHAVLGLNTETALFIATILFSLYEFIMTRKNAKKKRKEQQQDILDMLDFHEKVKKGGKDE